MPDLATVADVENRLGRPLTDDQLVRAEALLTDVSANVRRLSTQQFTPGTSTAVRLSIGRKGRARLPQRPVTAVTAVTDIDGYAVPYRLVGDELRLDVTPLNAWELEPRRTAIEEVLVTYTHGGTVPDVIVGVVCSVVLRAVGVDPTQVGIMQESIDGYSYTTGSAAAQGAIGLLPSEVEVCESFRRPAGAIQT